ncbi:hypothetical protein Pla108_40520 [Botrimarina colliarenosi]|uniref:Ice-binding protein C-terminal domain-containing protein n=1 Tax=Botrimarina colliarenosi TaxID=2528001 RepID=A0A5C5ZZA9_9BACT|nr:PEP-CTERM sorting domain-containing protein [Botrimarina colliarenosi]TWT92912.1 hypothetical protein Pla108_40520 [Botrimarina colliarenosi]
MRGALQAIAVVAASLLFVGYAPAQFKIDFDLEFDGPIPPDQNPGGTTGMYQFHGPTGNVNFPTYNLGFSHAIVSDGNGGFAYEQTVDSSGLATQVGTFPPNPQPPGYFYTGGGGGFFVPNDSGMTGLGEDDPANYRFSWDLSLDGQLSEVPLYFNFGQFDADYEVTYGIDANSDGDMLDGANTYVVSDIPVSLAMTAGFQPWSTTLNVGAATATGDTGVLPEHIVFDNENSIYFSWYFGHTEFGFDNDNTVLFDNIAVDFTAVTPIPGDYNLDGSVDAADYTVWRDNLNGSNDVLSGNGDESGPSAGVVDQADYDYWAANYGSTGGATAIGVPEPGSLLLAGLALVGASRRRNRTV